MAVLGSTLGLFLCLGLLFSSASATNHREHCMRFTKIINSSEPGIQVNEIVYENSLLYKVLVPVNKNISSMILRAVDKNNNSAGSWDGADEYCNTSVLYHVKDPDRGFFKAIWEPPSENTTEVILQAFAVDLKGEALFSFLELNTEEKPTTKKPRISTTSRTSTTRSSRYPVVFTTTRPHKTLSTTQRTTSSASGAFLNPIIDTIQILLVFFTSKLLF